MIKISGKVDKPTLTTNDAESIVSVGLPTFPLIFIILSNLPKSTFSPYIYIYIYI